MGVRLVFLDISKTSDKLWHDGVKREQQKRQLDVLNVQLSSWAKVNADVPQGSLLVPLLLLILPWSRIGYKFFKRSGDFLK